MDLADIRFIVDENTLAVGRVVADLRQDTACIGMCPVIDLLPRESPDREWIPLVARQGWVVITTTIVFGPVITRRRWPCSTGCER